MKINAEHTDPLHPDELQKLQVLLDRYAAGDCTAEERQAIEQWYESLSGDREADPGDEQAAHTRIWQTVQAATAPKSAFPWIRWAAALALLAVAGIFTFLYSTKSTDAIVPAEAHWITRVNNTAVSEQLVLPDGSTIGLQPGASLRYPEVFREAERIVHLGGEASFDIRKDAAHPFKVLTGDITTRVLGTSFIVKTNAKASVVEVDVRSGSVSVYDHARIAGSNGENEGVILTPNQKVTYYKEDSKWITELVADPQPVAASAGRMPSLVYKDSLVHTVLQDIAALYRIEILVDNEGIYNCPFTGDLSQMGLHDVMKVVCRSIRADYKIKGTRILISGAGCASDVSTDKHAITP